MDTGTETHATFTFFFTKQIEIECLSESTVKTIWKKKDEIKAYVNTYGTSQCDVRKCVWDEKLIKWRDSLLCGLIGKKKKAAQWINIKSNNK